MLWAGKGLDESWDSYSQVREAQMDAGFCWITEPSASQLGGRGAADPLKQQETRASSIWNLELLHLPSTCSAHWLACFHHTQVSFTWIP